MPSFDIVSELNTQEVDNAINQAKKEIEGRYDFKGSNAELNWDKKEVVLLAEDDYKIQTMVSILQTKLGKRGVDLRTMVMSKVEPAGGRFLLFLKVLKKNQLKKLLSSSKMQS
jgi:cyclic-di-GMP-binding protein